MSGQFAPPAHGMFVRGTVVVPVEELQGVEAPNGLMIASDVLGPGIVEKIAPDGRVRVCWMDAEFDAWMDPSDVHPRGANAHVISVYRCDGDGHNHRLQNKVVESAILEHNWRVEMRPAHVIRTVRDDGAAWTFRLNTALLAVTSRWPQPPEDADAEALAATELAVLRSWERYPEG